MSKKLSLREIKLLQEKAHDEKVKWDRLSDRDPRKGEAFDKMQSEAAKCGEGLKDYWIRNGRKILR